MNKTTIKKCIYCGQSENSSAQAHIGAQAILDISKKLKNMTSDRDEWRQQHENLLSMYQTASDERATLKALSPQGEPTISKMETVEPIGYLRFISNTNVKFIHNLVLKGASPIITTYPDLPVYLAPQSELFGKVEQLNKDKAELIAYARKLIYAHELNATTMKKLAHTRIVAEQALAIPQPKCMESE